MLKRYIVKLLSIGTSASAVLISSIVIGSLLGHFSPSTSEWLSNQIDYTLLALVGLLFFGVRFEALYQVLKQARFIAIAVFANFVAIPLIGYGVASLFLSAHPLVFVGLVIYFMSPCTDWFLSFTKLSKGNVALGTALIPINMVIQLLLYPIFLQWFTQSSVHIESGTLSATLMQWFLVPLIIAVATHQILRKLLSSSAFERVLDMADQAATWITALLVLQIFAGNIPVTLEHVSVLAWVLVAVFCFFFIVFVLGETITRIFKLHYPERVLLSMTMASRNAPLMLAVSVVALPDQPLIYAALVIGMLIEIPHLTLLRYLLLRSHNKNLSPTQLAT